MPGELVRIALVAREAGSMRLGAQEALIAVHIAVHLRAVLLSDVHLRAPCFATTPGLG